MNKNKYIQDLAWELKLTENMPQEAIVGMLTNMWDIAEIEGQKKINLPSPTPYIEYSLGDTPKCPICYFSLEENHSCIKNVTDTNL
jgi:hypothetical protein